MGWRNKFYVTVGSLLNLKQNVRVSFESLRKSRLYAVVFISWLLKAPPLL